MPRTHTVRLLEILGDLRSNVLLRRNTVIQTFHPDLSDMQRDILRASSAFPCRPTNRAPEPNRSGHDIVPSMRGK